MKLISEKKKKVLLNITPLVDVTLILIIFFVITSTFIEQPGIKLELPKAQTSDLQRVEKAVIIVSKDSKIYFRNKEISLKELPSILKDSMRESIDKSLIISADKVVHHGLIISIMDIARQNGVKKLVVSTEPEK
jgi:biopolymer transport protein ExbD